MAPIYLIEDDFFPGIYELKTPAMVFSADPIAYDLFLLVQN